MREIEQEHPEYAAGKAARRMYRDLYAGGMQMKRNALDYLAQRQKEPADVYGERLSYAFYENYVGSIIDWYAATLFRREPLLTVEGSNEQGRQFFAEFAEDCDLKGTSLTDFYRGRLVETLVQGKSYALVDFPRTGKRASNRAEEEAMGASRAYLVECSREDLTNWSLDERGNYDWVVLRTSQRRKPQIDRGEWTQETRWLHYDREWFREYRQRGKGDEKSGLELVAEGPHALAKQKRVPLFELAVSDGLWLMNKAGLVQLEHFNKSNALAWALTQGLFAMPVVYSGKEWKQIVGESYYIQLDQGDRFGWTEPEGKVYQIAAENLNRLKEEIYRVSYLMTQAGGSLSSPAAQSGLSKQRDFAITQEVLRAYGDAVKDSMKRVLRAVEAAREDGLTIDVSGLDEFDMGDFSGELDDAQRVLGLGIESKTLRREVFKKLAFKYLCDMRQGLKDQISQEIDEWLDRAGN
ncbi:MAG: hypothetical protein HY822_08545 [Acidobacteria bacterium]|nr:hypothetical protein [Acidobacteriota bacterium]